MSIVRVESKQKKTYLDGFFVFYQSFIPLAYISPGYFRNNAIPNLNSWIIHAFMKQERNHRKVWETSFKNKVIPTLILFLKTYMYRIPHNIHSIFIFMFIEKTLKIIININLHYFPPMCSAKKLKWPMRSWRTLLIGCWKMGPIRGNTLAPYLNMIRKSGQRAITPTKKSSQRNSIFLTHKSYGYSEKCMRPSVCLWYGKKGEGLTKTVMGRSGHVFFLFSSSIWAWN
jgi:hypothetical protein